MVRVDVRVRHAQPLQMGTGARRSTPLVAPRLGHGENDGTRSSASVSVPCESDAPTANRSGSNAGLEAPARCSCGAGSRCCRPTRRRRCRASTPARPRRRVDPSCTLRAVGPVGEVQDPDVQTGVLGVLDDPIDGAITWETSVPPSAVPTLTLTIRASGAMPR
jgi:hypothetical protein